jgi:Fe2+ transport system protein FeoA
MLTPGRSGKIIKVNGEGAIRLRLLDMGLTPKTDVLVYKAAPMGDPIELHLRGYSLSIRMEEAQNIEVEENRA